MPLSANLALLRDQTVAALAADERLGGARVYAHGGEFTHSELQRYATQAPCVVVAVLKTDLDYEGGIPHASVTMGAVCVCKDQAGTKRDYQALTLADAVMRSLMLYVPDHIDLDGASAPQHMTGRNLYTTTLDREGIAMWAVGWVSLVDLADEPIDLADFGQMHLVWDVTPRDNDAALGDVPEATDDIDLDP